MIRAITVRSRAEQDIASATAWYEGQRPGLGQRFLDEVVAAYQRIARVPALYPMVHRHTRRAIMRKFPFGIYYRAEKDRIVIVAVLHGHRHPQTWQRRA